MLTGEVGLAVAGRLVLEQLTLVVGVEELFTVLDTLAVAVS
jgi:hypothetical protein